MLAFPRPQYDKDGSRTLRTMHWRDGAIDKQAGMRSIQNFSQWYRSDAGIYAPTWRTFAEPASLPYGWDGPWRFKWAQLDSPMQSFVSDAPSGAEHGCLWGMRLSWRPDLWVNFQLTEQRSGRPAIPTLRERRVVWQNVQAGSGALILDMHRHAVKKTLRYRSAPGTWARFAIRQPPGCTFEIVGGRALRFLDADGVEYMRTRPAYGWWGADDASSEDAQAGRVGLVEDEPERLAGEVLRTVRLAPFAADFSSATFPLYIDPSTAISGTTDLEDSYLFEGRTRNYGGSSIVRTRGGGDYRGIIRIASSAIPSEVLTGVAITCTAAISNTNRAVLHRILPGNVWVEGSGDGTEDAGVVSWNYRINTTDTWQGAAGCDTAGVDYASATMGTTPQLGPAGETRTGLLSGAPAVLEAWRDAEYENNGALLLPASMQNPITWCAFASTESGTYDPWSIEVYYSTGGKRRSVAFSGNAFGVYSNARPHQPGQPFEDF